MEKKNSLFYINQNYELLLRFVANIDRIKKPIIFAVKMCQIVFNIWCACYSYVRMDYARFTPTAINISPHINHVR